MEALAIKSAATPYINPVDFEALAPAWRTAKPFSHVVIDNFLQENTAQQVQHEFPAFNSRFWNGYDNAIEIKKIMNHWDRFGPATYRLFAYFNSREFIDRLEVLTGCRLYADIGLNGGGLHIHARGGKLNTHLDYSIHPKLQLERRLNLLVYMTPGWDPAWGGRLGLWSQHPDRCAPDKMQVGIDCLFNRAVLFDTTQDSWHGLPEPINCPEDFWRTSLAVYYLCDPHTDAATRGKALFAPHGEQARDPEVLELIRRRSQVETAAAVYGDR